VQKIIFSIRVLVRGEGAEAERALAPMEFGEIRKRN
jgi:hypothetical protein